MNREERIARNLQTPRMFWVDLNFPANSTPGLQDLIQKYVRPESIVVEIGSFRGVSSELFACYCKTLYCVDPFTIGDPDIDVHLQDAEVYFDQLVAEMDNIIKIKKKSVDAATDFENLSLDVVYIDAMHDYENVKTDINAWKSKIKPGGIISGHDFNEGSVAQAVRETLGEPEIFSDFSWAVVL